MRSFARRSILAFVVGVLVFVSRPSAADEPLLPPVGPSGAEGGAFFDQVDPRSGAMTYTYRFELPAARGISGPGALHYNSSTHDGEPGYGWGLELPSIELRPLAGLARFDASGAPLPIGRERYAFQGQPLVKICDVGGGCAAESSTQGHPSWATGFTYYRLQNEGLFARFYGSANRRTWRVQFKGGELIEFGAPIGESYGMPEALEQKAAALGAIPGIVRWHPVIRRDLQHPNNVVVYRWQPYGTRGILLLASDEAQDFIARRVMLQTQMSHARGSRNLRDCNMQEIAHRFIFENGHIKSPGARARRSRVLCELRIDRCRCGSA